MGDQLQDRFLKYLDHVEKAAGKVGEFAETEIPLTIQEWLRWNFYESLLYSITFFIVALLLIILGQWCIRVSNRWYLEYVAININNKKVSPEELTARQAGDCLPITMLGLFLLVSTVFPLVHCFWNAKDCIKAATAPRVVVVEKIAELTKGKK